MICVEITKKQQEVSAIKISGHSGYSESGSDIVCAAVSSIVTTTINGILSFKKTIEVTASDNPVEFKVLEYDEITRVLIDNMLTLLKEVEKEYKKYIRMEEKHQC